MDNLYPSYGFESSLTVTIQLDKAISPLGEDNLYDLEGEVTLEFNESIAEEFGIEKTIKKELSLKKEHAAYNHVISTSWEVSNATQDRDIADLRLLPLLDDNDSFKGEWMGRIYLPIGFSGFLLEGTVIDNDTLKDTGISQLSCKPVDQEEESL